MADCPVAGDSWQGLTRVRNQIVYTRGVESPDGNIRIVPLADYFNHGSACTEIEPYYDEAGNYYAYTTYDVPAGSPLRISCESRKVVRNSHVHSVHCLLTSLFLAFRRRSSEPFAPAGAVRFPGRGLPGVVLQAAAAHRQPGHARLGKWTEGGGKGGRGRSKKYTNRQANDLLTKSVVCRVTRTTA